MEYDAMKHVFHRENQLARSRGAERRWAANRSQCGSRSIRGMLKGWQALRLHLAAELGWLDLLPQDNVTENEYRRRLTPAQVTDRQARISNLNLLTSSKFKVIAALQAYAQFEPRTCRCLKRAIKEFITGPVHFDVTSSDSYFVVSAHGRCGA